MIYRLRDYYRKAVSDLRYQGLEVLLWRIIVKLMSPLVRLDVQILFEYDLTRPIPRPQTRVDCEIGTADEGDMATIARQRYAPQPAKDETVLTDSQEYERAFYERQSENMAHAYLQNSLTWLRAGEMCFVARIGDDFAHSNWIRFDWCGPSPHREIRLFPGEVYTTDGHTLTPWRGQRLHEAVNAAMLRYAQSIGCKRAYTITDLTLAWSRRGVKRVGWQRRGHHAFITPRWLGKTWIVRLGGNVEPILREALGASPAESTSAAPPAVSDNRRSRLI